MSALLRMLGRLRRDESGQAMVEFVLVFPIQLVLSLCVLQFAFIAHAHLVVEQAAFMGARAAAVADAGLDGGFEDVDGWRVAGEAVAKRVAARTCAVLTSAQPAASGSSAPAPSLSGDDQKAMSWRGERVGHELARVRVDEAFRHLDVAVMPYPDDGYVGCRVTYDYVMVIPVANHIFAQAQMKFGLSRVGPGDRYNAPSEKHGRTCFRVTQVSFISTPWTRKPQ